MVRVSSASSSNSNPNTNNSNVNNSGGSPRHAGATTTNIDIGNGTTSNGRGSPSEVFSPNILEMEKRKKDKKNSFFKWFSIIAAILCVLFMVSTIILAVLLGSRIGETEQSVGDGGGTIKLPLKWPKPSGSLNAEFKRAAVATDHGLCSEIGRDIYLEGGNAVDSAIASLLCIGVVNPQSSGIGGGFIMTLYNASTARCITIDARETAPNAANSTMYINSPMDSLTGYKAIATPGEVHGYWTVFRKFSSGKVPWPRLFEPSIRLARDGFPVSSNLASVLRKKEDDILGDEDMRRVFVDSRTGRVYEEGDVMKRERLAELLIELANATDPVELFYKDGIAQTIAGEMKDNGGYVTLEDLMEYKTIIHETPLESDVLPEQLAMCGPPPPSSFVITQAIVGIMGQFYGKKRPDLDDLQLYHRLIESEKFAYAQRGRLGDIDFVKDAMSLSHNMTKLAFSKWISKLITEEAHEKEYYSLNLTAHVPDHGTSHVIALDHNGNGVSVTSTVNQLLGAKRVSPTLGIVWNDEMDDFSTPNTTNNFGFAPSPANYIEPKKRPMSSMSPTIVYDKRTNRIKMIVGASGGSRIISAVAQTIIRTMLFDQTVKEAVDAPRLHNQFLPHSTEYENSFPKEIIHDLQLHRKQNLTAVEKQPSVVQALLVLDDGFIHANSDFRRKTSTYPSGY